MPTVRSVMTPAPRTIPSVTPIRAALTALETGGIRHLPIVDDGALVGIVSDRDLRAWRQALLDETGGEENPLATEALDAPVSTLMVADVWTVAPDAPVREAVALLLEHHVGALPVVGRGTVVGLVTRTDLLELLGDRLDADPDVLCASDLMTTDVGTVRRGEPVTAAVDVMLDRGVRHVPVLDPDGRLVGLVSQRDVLAADDEAAAGPVDGIMVAPVTVAPDTPLAEVARLLREREFGCVPVVDEGCLLGVVTEADFVATFTREPEGPFPEAPSAPG